MKKLIAISVVFALVAGVAFAVDVGGTVIGTAQVLQGNTGKDAVTGDSNPVTSGGGLGRVRLEGSGEAGDGNFGGWIRFDPTGGNHIASLVAGIAWWKPIDQFKLSFGGNPDGIWAKEGVAAWMFNQMASDAGVTNPHSAWEWDGGPTFNGSSYYPLFGLKYRNAFFGGFGDQRVYMTISPAEIADINIGIPFIAESGKETADVFKKTVAQLDLKLDFGNIALTYDGNLGYDKDKGYNDPASIYAYFGGSFGDISIDFGLGYTMAKDDGETAQPIGVGLGVKYSGEGFGVKFRTVAALAGDDEMTRIRADVLPFFNLSDTLRVFVDIGIGMAMGDGVKAQTGEDSIMGWHFNPYIEVGNEWGPAFYAGIKAWSDGVDTGDGAITRWEVPIGIIVSF